MSPELKLAAHMDKEDVQDNLESLIEQRAESLFNHIYKASVSNGGHFVEWFVQSGEFEGALVEFTDRVAREEFKG